MSYFILPKILIPIKPSNLNLVLTNKKNDYISITLKKYLITIKNNIEKYPEQWDNVKKQTNPYEYIHTIIPGFKYAISKYKPISRSYFKMIEIANLMNLLSDYEDINIKCFSLCEGPGGFIEALINLRKNKDDTYYGMTLQSSNTDIPGWKKINGLTNNYNLHFENGIDKSGDITKLENFLYCYEKYKNSFEILTGDGGFDFSDNFDDQEYSSLELILCQICLALVMQKKRGKFVLKIFDIHSKFMVDILFILSSLYEKVYVMKPNTSRYANSEKYIICKNFKLDDSSIYLDNFIKFYRSINETKKNSKKYFSSLISLNTNYYFYNKIEEINSIIGQQQIEMINNTINIIETSNKEKLDNYKKININRSIQWCSKYNVDHNKNELSENTFIQ